MHFPLVISTRAKMVPAEDGYATVGSLISLGCICGWYMDIEHEVREAIRQYKHHKEHDNVHTHA